MPEYSRALVRWRRDLREFDHAALYHAPKCARPVACVFLFDRDILDALQDPADRRAECIHASVAELQQSLQARGCSLIARHGVAAREEIVQLAACFRVAAMFFNHDADPAAVARVTAFEASPHARKMAVQHDKDAVIFEPEEVLTASGTPVSVFTPYKNAWLRSRPPCLVWRNWGLLPTVQPNSGCLQVCLAAHNYSTTFSDISTAIRKRAIFQRSRGRRICRCICASAPLPSASSPPRPGNTLGGGAQTRLSELVWRDFHHQIFWHRPDVAAGHTFKPQYNALLWPNPAGHFGAWRVARTGYPLVDWRLGERYFSDKLVDFNFAANNGSWQ
jgi:deoxyribodipyrimidine photo-lyase